MGDRKNDLRFNGSGYYDPTPYEAIKHISEREKLSGRVVRTLQNVAHLAGFEIVGRIQLRDKESGEIYK